LPISIAGEWLIFAKLCVERFKILAAWPLRPAFAAKSKLVAAVPRVRIYSTSPRQ
jgi:hypothetical protein